MVKKTLALVSLALLLTTNAAFSASFSTYLPSLTGQFTPDYPPFENAGGKSALFDFGVPITPVKSARFEYQGRIDLPTFSDIQGNRYTGYLNNNAGFGLIGSGPCCIAWGTDLGAVSRISNPDQEFRTDYILNPDGTFYFSRIWNPTSDNRAIPTGVGDAHLVFYLHSLEDIQYYPEFENVWQELTLSSQGSVHVESARLGFSTDSLFAIDPFGLDVINPVPIPAAAWLFGSALLGLVGIGRNRKKV